MSGGNQVVVDFVFGVDPADTTDHFDPDDVGHLVLKSGQLPIAPNKLWLRQFCENLMNAPFYQFSPSCSGINTFLTRYTFFL